MPRRYLLIIIYILFSSQLSAQSTKNDLFIKSLLQWLWAPRTDTLYAKRSPYPFRVKVRVGTTFDILHFQWKENTDNIKLFSEPLFKVGAHVSYRNIGIGFMKSIRTLFNSRRIEESELLASAYGRTIGGDIAIGRQNSYLIGRNNNLACAEPINGVSNRTIYANGYYVFNNKRFSYPAALTHSYLQVRSCGSVILGISLYYNNLNINTEKFPDELLDDISATQFITSLKRFSLNVSCGYAYNKIINRHWSIHASILPSIPIISRTEYCIGSKKSSKGLSNTLDCLLRAAVIWDKERFFAGISTIIYTNELLPSPIYIRETYTRTTLSFGIRF